MARRIADEAWTLEEALEAQDEVEAARSTKGTENTDPLEQWWTFQRLRELEAAYLDGRREALLEGIEDCAQHGLPLPEWIAEAFLRHRLRAKSYHVESWADVFGPPFPAGQKRTLREKAHVDAYRVLIAGRKLRKLDKPIGPAFFNDIAAKVKMGRRQCKEAWYSFPEYLRTVFPLPMLIEGQYFSHR